MTPQEDQHAEDLVDVMCELAKQPSTRENAQLMAELTDPLTKEQLEIVLFGALGYIGAVYDQLGALMPTANTRGRL